jgi:hypothetical protein
VVQPPLAQHRDVLVDLGTDPADGRLDTPDSQPSARTRSSTFRVEVPVT